ncbi:MULTISPECIES: hypothetical protein [unclassified Microbacterium]|uniref:hypothetical protein n=1 Tax=unclassified Microbacterium TaxID=2609290 RepID=UPI00214AF5F5|nr:MULTISPECIES: hypothetical protein [unclassified Microbacterium]MCR2785575.1 hypothetical protein [Microbacterium sp. zg.B96]WIM17439.1 hypothetical protein QNO11_07350 [Microbacterium sp. zg-B96]
MGRMQRWGVVPVVVAAAVAMLLTGCLGPLAPLGTGRDPTLTPTATIVDPSLLRVVADDTGAVSVRVPAGWSDMADVGFTDEAGVAWYAVAAAPSLEAFGDSSAAAGVQVMAARGTGQNAETTFLALARTFDTDCALSAEPAPYRDAVHNGVFAVWDCAGTDAVVVSALNRASDNVVAIVQVATEDERNAGLVAILESFRAEL